jgi:hypothetical protein
MTGQDRDAVLLAQDADGGLEMQVHTEPGRDSGGLVDLPGFRATDANLLQGDDIRVAGRDDLRDPLW